MYFYQEIMYYIHIYTIHVSFIQSKFIYNVYKNKRSRWKYKESNEYATTSFLIAIMQIFHEYNIENYSLTCNLRINKDKEETEKLFDYFLGKF